MYSLIRSARLNGIGPEAYLHHVIERIADHPGEPNRRTPRNVAPLLPAVSHIDPVR
ncbi:transposase domain-containing protein [Paraburkholderia terricola]|uniref:Transposase IS66 C-terminal domain-containing protein n=1 Tax=Paraburkholderia terricola TaxID=169427 RepID=A0ABU1M380_9BURK|nr:hypothetical protein [Paraburkholderia terricola]MDR6485490.1 hypothetical protein [Paraburkholderia terricola]